MATVVRLEVYCLDCGCNAFEKTDGHHFCTECGRDYFDEEIKKMKEEEA